MPKRVSKKKPASAFEHAVDFLALTFNDKEDQTKYCNVRYNVARTYNMTIGLGTPIQVDMECCPHIGLLREAVTRCKDNFTLAQYSEDKLIIKQDDFHAFIPCLRKADSLYWTEPDPPVSVLGNDFIEAIDKVSPFADEKAERLLCAAIQLYSGSVLSTSGSVVVEAWHNFAMPEGLLLPKSAAKMLHRAKKELVSFGFSPLSITFHFADGSWLKSQLYKDKLPDIRQHIQDASIANLHDIPHNFFSAVAEVSPFSVDGGVWVQGNRVASHPFNIINEGSGITMPFDGPGHALRKYSAHDLHQIRHIAQRWDECGREDGTVFFGDKLRGMVWHKDEIASSFGTDDDIPS